MPFFRLKISENIRVKKYQGFKKIYQKMLQFLTEKYNFTFKLFFVDLTMWD